MIVVGTASGLNALVPVPEPVGSYSLTLPAGRAKLVLFDDPESMGERHDAWPERGR
jgi:hypothetical protein